MENDLPPFYSWLAKKPSENLPLFCLILLIPSNKKRYISQDCTTPENIPIYIPFPSSLLGSIFHIANKSIS